VKSLAIFLLAFASHVVVIVIDPIIFGGDTIMRLLHRDDLMMGHQLPMLQILISGVSKISSDPLLVRYLVALIGAAATLGFYWMIRDLFGDQWAVAGAVFFMTNPFFLALSTVPYQEILMLGGLVFAFHFFYTENWIAASLCLAIACLTRYEAWAVCPVLTVAYILRKDRSPTGWIKAALLFGWMPVVWILINRGALTSPGHFVVERSFSIVRLLRYPYLAWVTVRTTQITVVLLAAVGAFRLYKNRSLIDWRLQVQIAFVILFLLAIPFSAHGVPPDPERYVTSREAHIPIYFVLLLATLGLAQWPRWTTAIVAISAVLGLAGAIMIARNETSQPGFQLSYGLAKYLDSAVQGQERVLVLAKPIPEDTATHYFEKALQTGGEEGLRQAQLSLKVDDLKPLNYQRLLVYSRLGSSRLLTPPASCGEWVAVWSDYPDAARELTGTQPVEVLRSGPMSVTILRRRCE
jgi:hypothetical protein